MMRAAMAAAAAAGLAACAWTPGPASAQGVTMQTPGIQPETTISLDGVGEVDRAPDLANVSVGVSIDGETAAEAMSKQAEQMNGVVAALRTSGVAERDMQTSNLTLNPVYDYNRPDGRPRLTGYNASNEMRVTVRDIARLGAALDAIVKSGGNTINGVSFGLSKEKEAMNEARVNAIKDAAARAELYASAVGYRVKRIVTISETPQYQPQPVFARAALMAAESAPTPVAGGAVTTRAAVSVVFELQK